MMLDESTRDAPTMPLGARRTRRKSLGDMTAQIEQYERKVSPAHRPEPSEIAPPAIWCAEIPPPSADHDADRSGGRCHAGATCRITGTTSILMRRGDWYDWSRITVIIGMLPSSAAAPLSHGWPAGLSCDAADASVYPYVHVIGIPKAGTSYLYELVTSSPEIKPAYRSKEYCPGKAGYDMKKYFAAFEKTSADSKTANGCINTKDALRLHACVSPHLRFEPKYILSLRPPDEWQWARYNFWTNSLDARPDTPGRWTDSNSYRSPELFHQLVLAGNKTTLKAYASIDLVQNWIDLIEESRRTVGSSNLLLLLSSNLGLPETRASIAKFLGIRDDFGLPLDKRVNSGAKLSTRGASKTSSTVKAVQANHTDDVHTGNVYEISKFRPMRDATGLLIRQRNRGACCAMRYNYSIELGCCD